MGEQQMGGTGSGGPSPQPGSAGRGGGAAAAIASDSGPPVHQLRGDTTYTKVFVGGLAWETQRETMRRHFEQYGEIEEAVVIVDKNTGRSKGYGFVTFRDAEGARRACLDATPVIDGRRANCNLASLGAHRARPGTPLRGNRTMFGPMSPYSAHTQGGGIPPYMGSPAFPPQSYYPNYHVYGFSPYYQDYGYQQGLFNPYAAPPYPAQVYAGTTIYNPYGSMQTYTQPVQGGASGSATAAGAAPPVTAAAAPGYPFTTTGTPLTYPFSTSSSPGGSSTNSSRSSYHGGASAASPLSSSSHHGGGAHSMAAIANVPCTAPPLLPGVNAAASRIMVGSSPPLFAIPSTFQQLAVTGGVTAEQSST